MASVLGFAAPWGPIGAGALTFIDAVFFGGRGAQGATGTVIKEAIGAAVKEIEDFLVAQAVQANRVAIKSYRDWIDLRDEVLVNLGDNYAAYEDTLKLVDQMCKPGADTLWDAWERIEDAYESADSRDKKWVLLRTLANATGSLIFALRHRVVLAAKLAAIYEAQELHKELDDITLRWHEHYADLVIALNGEGKVEGFPKRFSDHLNPFFELIQSIRDAPPYPETEGYGDPLQYFTFHSYNERVEHFKRSDDWGSRIRLNLTPLPVKVDLGETGGPAWLIRPAFFYYLEQYNKMLSKWKAAGDDWASHTPPSKPTSAPGVGVPWQATTPQPPHWLERMFP